jgi:pimeloyl-ACP methyl ester carboxylesterase
VPKYRWHYSGTFFNFRTQSIFRNGVPGIQQKYGGTEAWPGDVCRAENAWCEFADNSPWIRQYDAKLMEKMIPDQLHWESNRYGDGPKMEQHVREFEWLVEQLRDCRSLLVIGSRHGGLEYHLAKRIPHLAGRVVAVDSEPLPDNTSPRLIIGSSHDHDVQEWLRKQGPFDAVFIDGDHTEAGVRSDWEFAKSLNAGKVFFHDFTDAAYHQLCNCEVHKMWPDVIAESKARGWEMSQKVVGCGWGGIGAVNM